MQLSGEPCLTCEPQIQSQVLPKKIVFMSQPQMKIFWNVTRGFFLTHYSWAANFISELFIENKPFIINQILKFSEL